MPADRIKNHRLQFPDISGKRIGLQQGDQFLWYSRCFFTQFFGCGVEKVIYQKRDVVYAQAQGRDLA